MRIVQLLESFAPGDAISNSVTALARLARAGGWQADVVAAHVHPRVADQAVPFAQYRWAGVAAGDLVLFHHSIGTPLVRRLRRLPGRKVLVYHNVTPAHFFAGVNAGVERAARQGRRQLRELKRVGFTATVSDSSFNRAELEELGFARNHVVPILLDFDRLASTAPDPRLAATLDDGAVNWVFVGRLAPNKRQDDLIAVFAHYQRHVNPRSRLLLVGTGAGMESYASKLEVRANELGIREHVMFLGLVSLAQLVACYRAAHVFVGMSEHEGFCVPLAESMLFDVPIVAYAAASVPETLGGAGILVRSKDPAIVSAIAHLAATDATLRQKLLATQRSRLSGLSPERVGSAWLALLEDLAAR